RIWWGNSAAPGVGQPAVRRGDARVGAVAELPDGWRSSSSGWQAESCGPSAENSRRQAGSRGNLEHVLPGWQRARWYQARWYQNGVVRSRDCCRTAIWEHRPGTQGWSAVSTLGGGAGEDDQGSQP